MPDPDLTPDGTLGALVTIVSQAGGEVGISLLVGGSWLSGLLVPGRAWFEQLAHSIEADSPEWAAGWRVDVLYPSDDTEEAGNAEPRPDDVQLAYVHLREARLVTPAGCMPTGEHGLLVKCRLSEVAAWSYGILPPEGCNPPPPPI
jgi:hypothetical protein